MPSHPRLVQAIVLAATLAFACKFALIVNTYGTNDVIFWEGNLAKIRAEGGLALYRDGIPIVRNGAFYFTEPFNQPPFMIHLLRFWGAVEGAFGLPLRFWLRLTSSLADIGSLILIWKILKPRAQPILLMALSPVAIMVSGFHGNTDPIMVFFALLSIYLMENRGLALFAGIALGMAMSIKIVPVIFCPAILLYLPSNRRRFEFAAGAASVFLLASMPYFAQDPKLVFAKVFLYNSIPRHWGFSRLVSLFSPPGDQSGWIFAVYLQIGKPLLISILLAASVWMNLRPDKPRPFLQFGFLMSLFLFWTPGFGVQYLAWLVPWTAALSGWAVWFWYLSSGIFLFEVYTYWSRGLPWYLADMLYTGDLQGSLVYFFLEMACWISVGCLLFAYRKRLISSN